MTATMIVPGIQKGPGEPKIASTESIVRGRTRDLAVHTRRSAEQEGAGDICRPRHVAE